MPSSTTSRAASTRSDAGPARARARWFVWGVAAVAVLARLPFVATPARPDEAGFLQVAHQWAPGGGSLYGAYWVDRPPLLIALYQLVDLLGGVVALRLLGCAAVAVTVVLCAETARRHTGDTASCWAAGTAGALLCSPVVGSAEINGELLAAPFVAGGLLALTAALETSSEASARRTRFLLSAGAGAAATAAVLVKQNVADVVVCGLVLTLALGLRGPAGRAWAAGVAAGAGAGAAAALALVGGWTVVHGTSPLGVLDAMYPFRLEAGRVVAEGGAQYAQERAGRLATAWVVSGLAALTLALAVAIRDWRRDALLLALLATAAYDALSIALGGGYWHHYLVQAVVPLAVAAGILAARGRALARCAVAVVALTSAVGVAVAATGVSSTSTAQQIGVAIADSARPGDTLTTLYGQPQVNLAAGLPSPYQHLWSLPIKTLDPQLTGLDAVIRGPDAPTWIVVVRNVGSWGLESSRTSRLLAEDYRPVASYDGQTVYLHDGLRRPPLRIGST